MDWVSEQIAIGGFVDALAVTPGQVDAVLCLKERCCDESNKSLDVFCVPLKDGPGNRLDLVMLAVEFIDSTVKSGHRILVHCHAGRSRSVCIVAKYLCLYKFQSPDQAIARIGRVRDINLTPGLTDIFNA